MQKTVLLVDDYEDSRKVMKILIESMGCRVIEARDGLEALKQVAKGHFDLILMDIAMPMMDGITTIKILKQHKPTRQTPIIVVTAHSAGEYREQAAAAGVAEFVSKPIDFETFNPILQKYLG